MELVGSLPTAKSSLLPKSSPLVKMELQGRSPRTCTFHSSGERPLVADSRLICYQGLGNRDHRHTSVRW
jgi:hypothetical protein